MRHAQLEATTHPRLCYVACTPVCITAIRSFIVACTPLAARLELNPDGKVASYMLSATARRPAARPQ